MGKTKKKIAFKKNKEKEDVLKNKYKRPSNSNIKRLMEKLNDSE